MLSYHDDCCLPRHHWTSLAGSIEGVRKDIVHATCATDDYDNTAEDFKEELSALPTDSTQSGQAPAPDFKGAVIKEREFHMHDPCFELDRQKIWKGHYLNECFKEMRNPGSQDHLEQYANIP